MKTLGQLEQGVEPFRLSRTRAWAMSAFLCLAIPLPVWAGLTGYYLWGKETSVWIWYGGVTQLAWTAIFGWAFIAGPLGGIVRRKLVRRFLRKNYPHYPSLDIQE